MMMVITRGAIKKATVNLSARFFISSPASAVLSTFFSRV